MANEISISAGFSASKGGASVAASFSGSLDMAGTEMQAGVQNIAATTTLIDIGGCDTVEAILIKNLDAAISLTIGLDTPITQVISVIKPGKGVLLTGTPTTLYAKAASSTVDAFIGVAEA